MLLFGLLALIVLVSREYNRLLQRLSARERIRITWAGGVAPTIAVVQARGPQGLVTKRSCGFDQGAGRPEPHACSSAASSLLQAAPRSAQHSRSQSAAAETGGMRGRGLWGLLRHQRSAAQPSPGGVAARAAQVWAAWRGPQRGSSDEGNQPLLDAASGLDGPADDAHQDGAHTAPDAVELSPPPPPPPATNGAAGSGAAPGGRRLFVSHDRQLSVDEEALTPHHLHSRLLAPHRQALLSSRLGALSAGPAGGHLPACWAGAGCRLGASSRPVAFWQQAGAGVLSPHPALLHHPSTPAGARRPELDVRFVGLGLRLRSCGKTVLQSVSGRLRPSALTAIMGPSGAGARAACGRGGWWQPSAQHVGATPSQACPQLLTSSTRLDPPAHCLPACSRAGAGKTSLLNTLAGKSAAYGVLSGRVLVNGVPDRLDRFKRVMGFVPQVRDGAAGARLALHQHWPLRASPNAAAAAGLAP